MGSLEGLKDAIEAERVQVRAGIEKLLADIQELKDRLDDGTVLTAEDFNGLIEDVNNIFHPDEPEPDPPVEPEQ